MKSSVIGTATGYSCRSLMPAINAPNAVDSANC